MNAFDPAYLAGLFDGEGCVSFVRIRNNIHVTVMVTNTHQGLLQALRAQFGGDIRTLSGRRPGWKVGYCWRIGWTETPDDLAQQTRAGNRARPDRRRSTGGSLMPYVSKRQERYFNVNRDKLEKQGVDVDEWNRASKGKRLPEQAPPKKIRDGKTRVS